MDVETLHGTLVRTLARRSGVRLAYLFGSQARGDVGPLSDWDVAVLVESSTDAHSLRDELAHALGLALGTAAVDVLMLNRAPVELAYAVIAQGVLLYQQDTAVRVEYEADVMSRYADYVPILRAQREEILQGGGHDRRVQRYRTAFGRSERSLGEIAAAHGQGAQ